MLPEIKRQTFQVIAENLSTAVVADLQTLVKSMKDDRRKVNQKTYNFKIMHVCPIWWMLLIVESGRIKLSYCNLHSPMLRYAKVQHSTPLIVSSMF